MVRLVALPVVEVVEDNGGPAHRYTAASGVQVTSSVPVVGHHWWDRHAAFGLAGSYMLWTANIAHDVGWSAPRRWLKRLDAKMSSMLL